MAQQRLAAFGAAVRKVGLQMVGLGSALIAPMLLAVRSFSAAGDQLHKMALRTGATSEALSELGFAAEQSGADINAIESGLRGMARFLLNAERGSAAAVDTLIDLGISMRQLQGLSPDQQLELLAEALSRVKDDTRRAALAMQVFGKSGTALLPLFADGAKGIQDLREEARQLGLSVSTQDAQAAADFGDAWNRVTRTLRAVVFNIGGALAPMLTDLANKVKDV